MHAARVPSDTHTHTASIQKTGSAQIKYPLFPLLLPSICLPPSLCRVRSENTTTQANEPGAVISPPLCGLSLALSSNPAREKSYAHVTEKAHVIKVSLVSLFTQWYPTHIEEELKHTHPHTPFLSLSIMSN